MDLQLAAFLNNSLVNGTGMRSVIFTSGCNFKCKGCHNQQLQKFDFGETVDISLIIDKIINNMPIISGITFSGGEPFEQAKSCIAIAKESKKLGLDIWCYTGYTFEELLEDPIKKEFLKCIDVLVDGRFIESQKDTGLKFKGSKNQRIINVKESLKKNKIIINE